MNVLVFFLVEDNVKGCRTASGAPDGKYPAHSLPERRRQAL